MKKKVVGLLASMIIIVALFSGCQKDTTSPGGTQSTFSFSNSEYTGIGNAGNHYYSRPISIRFNGDSTMSTFTYIVLNSKYEIVSGKITNVTVNDQGQTVISVSYLLPNEQQFNYPQTYMISADKSTLSGGAWPLYELVSMKLFPVKAPSIAGNWGTPLGYPDISGMSFQKDSTATYQRNGKTLTYGGDPTTAVHAAYKQDGGRLKFIGIK
jgi:hypothetical protein